MTNVLDQVRLASLPASALHVLADLRSSPHIMVALTDERAWVRWESSDRQVLSRLLPVSGVEIYVYREGYWYQLGHSLPAFRLPLHVPSRPLHAVLTPAPALPLPPPMMRELSVQARLAPDDKPRQTSAMLCRLSALEQWADRATTAELAVVRAARHADRVLLLGRRLPPLAGSKRFWGGRLLLPLGYRLEPALPELVLLKAWGVDETEFALYLNNGWLVLTEAVFDPLTRAGIRLALREAAFDG